MKDTIFRSITRIRLTAIENNNNTGKNTSEELTGCTSTEDLSSVWDLEAVGGSVERPKQNRGKKGD